MSDVGTTRAPFPWFGGKSRVAPLVWDRFGAVENYVEPFFGSGAVLLGRPAPVRGLETVNDKDGYVSNFWRSLQRAPGEVAGHADNPVNENDLHARHSWLVSQRASLVPRLEGDPDYYDAKIAGYWCWGLACWIGSGFCSGDGPWVVDEKRQLVHLGSKGQGVKRQRVHLGSKGQGVIRQRVHLANNQGVKAINGRGASSVEQWFAQLAARLENTRVCCGDWERVCGPSVTTLHGRTAVFLDPPYAAEAGRDEALYSTDDLQVSHAVRTWAVQAGEHDDMRIALCGYEGEHVMPASWECVAWMTRGGFSGQGTGTPGKKNRMKERIWFSPGCLT